MITFKNIDQNLYDPEGLKTDFRKTAKGKSGKEQVRKVKRNPEKYEKELERQLRTNTFTKATHQTETINEYSCKKTRELLKPTYLYEQPAHHALIRAIMPALMRGMYDLSCGSIPGRGPHYGKRFVEKWIRNDPKNCKYVLKFDIRHFFQSIPHRRLKKALKKEDPGPCNFKEIIRRDRLLQTGRTDRILYVAMVWKLLFDTIRPLHQRKTSRKENDPVCRRRGMFRQKQKDIARSTKKDRTIPERRTGLENETGLAGI